MHAGIIEPGHFRFTANGETVVRLEERLGYVHKGIEALMAGRRPRRAPRRLAGRTSGDSTVAYALAFARAAEAALGIEAPPRAVWLRALMAELERIANHLGDIGAICNDAAFALMHAHCGVLRERVLRAADACFGHRLMMDRIVPGGVAVDLAARRRRSAPRAAGRDPAAASRSWSQLYDNTASLQDRTVGDRPRRDASWSASSAPAATSGAPRAAPSMRAGCPAIRPTTSSRSTVPVLSEGDVNARVWIRIREVEQSLALIEQILERLPDGPICASMLPAVGRARAWRWSRRFAATCWSWLRLDADGRVERCHLRDPSWFQWPLLEAAIEGNIVADFPLCNKSFNCSYSGHDL